MGPKKEGRSGRTETQLVNPEEDIHNCSYYGHMTTQTAVEHAIDCS